MKKSQSCLRSTACCREVELHSRLETYLEQYNLTVDVEANLTAKIAKTMIFPAAIRYQNELATTCTNLKQVGIEFDTDTLDSVTSLVKFLQDSITSLEHAMADEGAADAEQRLDTNVMSFCLQCWRFAKRWIS